MSQLGDTFQGLLCVTDEKQEIISSPSLDIHFIFWDEF